MVLKVTFQGGPVSRKRIPMIETSLRMVSPAAGQVLNYAINPMSSGLLLTTKVGEGARGDTLPGRTSQPTSDERSKASKVSKGKRDDES